MVNPHAVTTEMSSHRNRMAMVIDRVPLAPGIGTMVLADLIHLFPLDPLPGL